MDLIERVSHPSAVQVEALVSFLEERPTLAKGLVRNPSAKARAIKEWEKITAILNSCRGGTVKSRKKWVKYWADKKSAVKKKCAARNAARRMSGGVLEDNPELSEIEERIVTLMWGGGDDHLQLQVFDPALEHDARHEEIEQEATTAQRHGDSTSATFSPTLRTFRAVRRLPPQRRSLFTSIADKFLKLEDQRLAHEGRVVKVMEEMARTHNVLADGVKAQAEAHKTLGEGLKVLGEGLKSLAESMKIYN
ncbi:uncharacterized protein LOC125065694 isoform X4 [Vanessa atalanta]|uniref:uncharacterized protein LOC125065694 isoform X4 n=1 Tax=Vanessa atalanta TaxID=42275 RepID=UPI001FCDDC3E|nr:uncharacterized protein LOC125065694 isoform X4 [Vanessa atalanta]